MKFFNDDRIISKTPTSRIELRNSNDEWLFHYNYDQKNQYFYYSNKHIYTILKNKFSLEDIDRHRLMKNLVKKYFNLHDCQPRFLINKNYMEEDRLIIWY